MKPSDLVRYRTGLVLLAIAAFLLAVIIKTSVELGAPIGKAESVRTLLYAFCFACEVALAFFILLDNYTIQVGSYCKAWCKQQGKRYSVIRDFF